MYLHIYHSNVLTHLSLLRTCAWQVVKLCELDAGDSVTAISWALKGTNPPFLSSFLSIFLTFFLYIFLRFRFTVCLSRFPSSCFLSFVSSHFFVLLCLNIIMFFILSCCFSLSILHLILAFIIFSHHITALHNHSLTAFSY
jgi:hypothetical protein